MTPDESTITETYIDTGDGHQLYVQDWGNATAKTPIIFLHGGPGSQVKNSHRQNFNPFEHRVIFFDQRGCGRSLPYGSLTYNTTAHLIEDIIKIADKLGLTKFGLYGASWGSLLALAFAIKYPERVAQMVLSGLFTGTAAEINYLDRGGFRPFFPDAWDNFLASTPKSHRADPSDYHFKRILGDNPMSARESAYIYSHLEGSLLRLDDRFSSEDPATFDATGTIIEVYYLANHCFLADRYIMDNAHKIKCHVWLVQARYDFVCPPQTAYDLHQVLPNSTLFWTMAGHGNDRSTYDVIRTIFAQWD